MRTRKWTGAVAIVAAMAFVVETGGTAFAAPVRPAPAPSVAPGPAVHGVKAVPSHFTAPHDAAAKPYAPTATRFPAGGHGSLAIGPVGARVSAAGTPVWAQRTAATGPDRVDVDVYDQSTASAAGVHGVIVGVTGDRAGTTRVGIDYSAFAQAYGGNYGSRLRLVRYPDCVLTTPAVAACHQATPLPSTNDPAALAVSAPVTFAGTVAAPLGTVRTPLLRPGGRIVLAAQSDPGTEGGSGGTYAATDLKPSGTWAGGGSDGAFTYQYPLAVAQSTTTALPKLALGYNSSSTDGQTASTQAQASWVGEGWELPHSFIEQSFTSCSDSPEGSASPQSTQDMCYDGQVLTLSLNGSSTSLVWDSTKSVWKSQDDDGTVIAHVTNSGNGQGTYNTDYWTVTERDGTVYSFGLNHLPGWASGKAATNSVDSEPVYSAHSGDPCYNATWSSSWCTMAYRWNLDYVKDVHGGAMSYYYAQDTNYYGRNKGATNTQYVRDSHLTRIDYGFTDGNAYGTVPDQIVLTTGDRCVSGTCQPLNSTNKANWPDVPFDLICASGATCTSWGPAFFSTVRLTGITSQQWSTTTSSYKAVDSYALTQTIPATGDGTSPTLWLSQIVHTGSDLAGGGSASPIVMPPVAFAAIQLPNRVDSVTDGLPAFYKYRIQTITTEAGSQINVNYGLPDPCTAPVTLTPSTNTKSCYPVSWTPTGYVNPFTDWFNKYVVTSVSQTDPTGGALANFTTYQYLGGAAWHFDDNELVKAKYRTYGQFRGYGDVQVRSGDGANDPQAMYETKYYRGMSKNNNTTVVNVTDSLGGVHEDVDQLAGKPLEVLNYLGDGGPVDHSSISSYWVSPATATRARTGVADLTANFVGPVEVLTKQALTSTGTTTWQYNETDTSYDATATSPTFGLVLRTYDHTSPVNTAYDKCTSTSYAAANTAKNLVGLVSEVEIDSKACSGYTAGTPVSVPGGVNTLAAPTSLNRPAQVVDDTRKFYDDPAWSTTFPQAAAPSKGDVTMVRKAVTWSGSAFTLQTTERSAYDSYGRQVDAYNGNGNLTHTAFTVNSVGLTTGVTITNPLGRTTSSTLEPGRGSTLTGTDLNGVVTTEQYDALGRLTSVWLASRATTLPADYKYTYVISNTGTSSATTQKLNDESGYQTSTVIYDALLRPRQTQAMTPQGGRIVTDTFYDSHGWTSAKYNGWWDPATTPNTTLVSAANLHDSVPDAHVFVFDGLGRTVIDKSQKDGVEISRTTTVYNGDRTTVIPPTGGITETTVTDPTGRTVETDQYTAAPTLATPANTFTGIFRVSGGTTRAISYTFDGHGNESGITQGAAGSGGPTWTSTYDLLGRVTSKTDPDAGTTTGMTYDGDGNLTQTTDGRGRTISYRYDATDRKTGMFDSTVAAQVPGAAGNELSDWVYDNSNNAVAGMRYPLGQLTTSTSYSGGNAYVVQQKNFNIFGSSLGTTITIPASEGALAGSYTFSHTYSTTKGLALKDVYPAAGGLPAETVNHTYAGVLDLPDTLGGLTGYSQGTTYDAFSRVTQETLGAAPNLSYVTNTWDPHTGRLTDQLLTRAVGTPTNVDDEAYTYDLSGNITRQVSTRLGASATSETQCRGYDALDQLTSAWTATDNCAAAPTAASHAMVGDNLGTVSAYWTTWVIDNQGERTQQVTHAFTGGPASDTTTYYCYGTTGGLQPHTLTSTATSGATCASPQTTYGYDAAGNMATRNAGQGSQSFVFDDVGRVSAVNGSTGGNSTFIYDADGNQLLQKDPGTTTLYVGGQQLALNTSTSAVTGIRYYSLPGGGMVARTGAGSSYGYVLTDPHGTPTLYLDATAQTPTWRQYTPYGAPRGAAVTAPDDHGFLNKTLDATTGLTTLGARQYDPVTGRFISDDPMLESKDPAQINGYAYASNNPVAHSDPTGKMLPGGGGGLPVVTYDWNVMPGIAENIYNAITHRGLPSILTRATTAVKEANRKSMRLRIWNKWNFGSPDEYPFASSVEGGRANGAILKSVAGAEQDAQGGLMSSFYRNNGITAGDQYQVEVKNVPDDVKARLAAQAACNTNSFAPGARVLMGDGTTKRLDAVRVGDVLRSEGPAGAVNQPVTALYDNRDTLFTTVTVAVAGRRFTLPGTQHHPYWSVTAHNWVDAVALRVGDRLQTADGTAATVVGVRSYTGRKRMLDVTVADTHAFYVLAGDAVPILVHNCGGGSRAGALAADGDEGAVALSKGATALKYVSTGLKGLGVVGTVAAVGFDVYDIATAPPQQKARIATDDALSLAGAFAGAEAGAIVGAEVAPFLGPAAPLAPIVGAVVGGIIGSGIGKDIGNAVSNFFGWG